MSKLVLSVKRSDTEHVSHIHVHEMVPTVKGKLPLCYFTFFAIFKRCREALSAGVLTQLEVVIKINCNQTPSYFHLSEIYNFDVDNACSTNMLLPHI